MASSPAAGDLRARNLTRNRRDVAEAALELFEARGFDAVTIDDIATAAGISRRTFFRYFDSKESALLPFEDERLEDLRRMLADRPATEPVLATVRRVTSTLAAGATEAERADALRRLRVIQASPSVRAHSLEMQRRWEVAVRDVVAEVLGVAPATSVAAGVIAGATLAALRAAVEVWLATDGTTDVAGLVAEAYDVLVAGLAIEPS